MTCGHRALTYVWRGGTHTRSRAMRPFWMNGAFVRSPARTRLQRHEWGGDTGAQVRSSPVRRRRANRSAPWHGMVRRPLCRHSAHAIRCRLQHGVVRPGPCPSRLLDPFAHRPSARRTRWQCSFGLCRVAPSSRGVSWRISTTARARAQQVRCPHPRRSAAQAAQRGTARCGALQRGVARYGAV